VLNVTILVITVTNLFIYDIMRRIHVLGDIFLVKLIPLVP